ncbi:pectate lyase [Streptomyces sp. MP131-18]|uniref:pectate lyase n=1 Tax=Streptomyces sp. MP131-18 TaxID=1857892 RepID=UPI00097BE434|nr:pectate lyase [Streptomyces sp. MP131-18]ONK16236.1 pectate lyase [Streptomyces sp. MP131-18]
MKRRTFTRLAAAAPLLGTLTELHAETARAAGPGRTVTAMSSAGRFMNEHLSYRGAYVWAYRPDLSRTWGEMEARRTMCWVQPPGTPTVGHSMLDAYYATGEEPFYAAAERTGLALVNVQLPCGGWNYVHDFAGENALKRWYATVGANGWRLEEFQHHYGNATFDDAGTTLSAQLLLRLYLERRHPRIKAALDRAIAFVLSAQFKGGAADGGWPQRYPRVPGAVDDMPWPDHRPPWLPADVRHGMEDGEYTGHLTFNDGVLIGNLTFLLMCANTLGRRDLVPAVERAMAMVHRLQQPAPQPGWGLQHLSVPRDGRPAGAPAGARSYEPRGLAPEITQNMIRHLCTFVLLTGDRSHLRRVPEAIRWLETCRLTEEQIAENPLLTNRTHPTYVELGTNRARFTHRFGSNIRNGAYYFDYDHKNTLGHSHAAKRLNIPSLWETYDQLMTMNDAELADWRAASPLTSGGRIPLPRYFTVADIELTHLFRGATLPLPTVEETEAAELVAGLGNRDHWLVPLDFTTNPCLGPPPVAPYDGTAFMSTHVGDTYDTSPYDPAAPPAEAPYEPREPEQGITTDSYTANMARLIAYVATRSGTPPE